MFKRHVVPSREIIGKHVSNSWSEDLGVIEDVVLDLNTGCVAYAVLSFRGIRGVGTKYFAIPWAKIRMPKKGAADLFALKMDREDLLRAPGFEPDNWPDMADSAWMEEMERHYLEVIHEPH